MAPLYTYQFLSNSSCVLNSFALKSINCRVTKEHREQLSKNAKQLFVKCKDSVRDVQIKFVKQVKRKDKVSEDVVRSVEQQIVAIADQYIAQAEGILNKKQAELLG